MRILHVTDTYLPRRGGIELHVHDLAQVQRRDGHEVDILTVTRPRGAGVAQSTGTLIRPADGAGLLDKTRFILGHRHLGALGNYDVVHGHCSTVSPLVFAALAVAEVPTAVTVHSLWRRYEPIYRAADITVGWSRWPVAWSAVSQAAADSIVRAAARPLAVDVVPNGIDLTAWCGSATAREPGRLRVVSVMRLAPRKRPMALLRLLHGAYVAMPAGVRLDALVIGDGPEGPAMRRYIRRHGLDGVVTLTGHLARPEIARRLAEADVFLAPATLESFGIAALEAAAAGVPVLGRRGTGLSEFVRDGAGGRLVDTDQDLSRALLAVARGELSLAPATTHVLTDLGWPAVVRRTAALYARAGVREAASAVGPVVDELAVS